MFEVDSVYGQSMDGAGFDQIVFYTSANTFQCGLPSDYDDTALTITIGPISVGPPSEIQAICLDTGSFGLTENWIWALGECDVPKGEVAPSWDGLWCFPIIDTATTDVKESVIPATFALRPTYPNPFNASTSIRYSLPTPSTVTLSIFDLLGRHVRTLVQTTQGAGEYRVVWDGHDDADREVASGVYFSRLRAGDDVQTRKMVMVR